MSAAAAWSYTATATLWVLLGRDDWTGAVTYGAPQAVPCDYSAKAERRTDALGVEFTTRQIIYTERADIKRGDRIVIGTSTSLDPVAAGAAEVRSVQRHADTFDRLVDDFEVAT
jgi:hypothetical protein